MRDDAVLVSVIIPTYNRAEYLARALESVMKQTYSRLEIIVVDDHSDDGTSDLMSDYKRRDKRIISLRNPENRGNGFARALGVTSSTGAFISFLDDDDEWLENKIEFQLQRAEKIGKPALILCNGFDSVRVEKHSMDLSVPEGFLSFKENTIPLDYALPNPSHWFFPRAVVDIVGNFDASFLCWVDADYLLRIFLKNIPVYYCSELLVKRYRLEGRNHVSRVGKEWLCSKELFLRKHHATIKTDRRFLCKFYRAMAKDYVKINEKEKARIYFLNYLKLKPYALDAGFKYLKTFV